MADRSDVELLVDLLAREQRLVSAYEAALRRDAIDASLGEALLRPRARARVRARADARRGAAIRRASGARRRSSPPRSATGARSRVYAIGLEDETVAAYADGVPRIRDPKLRQPLGSIMCCGGAHVVALKDSLGPLPRELT